MAEFDALYHLRPELEILQSASDASGDGGWIIHDPVQNRYFRIDQSTQYLLKTWQTSGSLQQALMSWHKHQGQQLADGELDRLMEFVLANHLVMPHQDVPWQSITQQAAAARQSAWHRWASAYLFFKVPVWRPQMWLERTWPQVAFLFSKPFALIVMLVGLMGLYLVSRQWDQFVGTFDYFFTLEGISILLVVVILLKSLHELGHAFMAIKFGCRVPVMGIAFMVFTPMLYTDVSDAWRLSSRKERLLISAAGILVELGIAAVAMLAWAFLPDGIGRSIAFMLASSALVMSLLLNLNPCMRFDGYYLCSDLLGIDNLQPRSFALARWKLRQLLLAPTLPPPEDMSRGLRWVLIAYGWITWGYRLVVFTAIALMVYHFAFKLLGLLLFALEIWLLILLPIGRELVAWTQLPAANIHRSRVIAVATAAGFGLLLLVVPWSTRISAPAILVASDVAVLYPAQSAQIVTVDVKPQDQVFAGQSILTLRMPQLSAEMALASIQHKSLTHRINQSTVNERDLRQQQVLQQQDLAVQRKLSGLEAEQTQLDMRAPAKGWIMQLAPDLHEGRWVSKDELLALVATSDRMMVKAYIAQEDVARLSQSSSGTFIPDDISRPTFGVRLARIAKTNSTILDQPELASIYGGDIAVQLDESQQLIPKRSRYLAELSLAPSTDDGVSQLNGAGVYALQTVNGVIKLDGEAESLLIGMVRQAASVIMAELGF